MFKIKVYTIGKIKESWLSTALEEYEKRLKTSLMVEWVLAKDDPQLESFLSKEPRYICLDPEGSLFTSEEFSQLFHQELIANGSRLCFVIGGPAGFPPSIKMRSTLLISLSRLTFTHQLVRILLLEQIYRALEIAKGSPYHK